MNYIVKTEIKEIPKLTDLEIDDLLEAEAVKLVIDYFIKIGKSLSESISLAECEVEMVSDLGKIYTPTDIYNTVIKTIVSKYRDNYCYCISINNDFNSSYIFWKFSSDLVDKMQEIVNYYSSDHISIEKITIEEAIKRFNSSKGMEEEK